MNNPETEKAVEDIHSLSVDALRDGACWGCLARAMAQMACGIIEHYSGDEDAVTAFLEESARICQKWQVTFFSPPLTAPPK